MIRMEHARPVSRRDLDTFERVMRANLPDQYREVLLSYNGAKPEANIFVIPGTSNESGVNEFIPLDEIAAEGKRVDGVARRFIPVAWAEGGNYICIDLDAGGEVFFWDHERPSGPLKMADDWSAFVNMLQRFDVTSVTLKPGQVKSARIDPDFLKSLKNKDNAP